MAKPAIVVPVDVSTRQTVERTRLAYERTLMAWVRTGTSLISFGFTIYKFFHEFHATQQAARADTLFGAREFGLIMISIGVAATVLATVQHRGTLNRLRAQYPEIPYSLAFLVALLISLLGVLALLAVFFHQ
jgi:putative membrane protein